jgi:hypothetical protein
LDTAQSKFEVLGTSPRDTACAAVGGPHAVGRTDVRRSRRTVRQRRRISSNVCVRPARRRGSPVTGRALGKGGEECPSLCSCGSDPRSGSPTAPRSWMSARRPPGQCPRSRPGESRQRGPFEGEQISWITVCLGARPRCARRCAKRTSPIPIDVADHLVPTDRNRARRSALADARRRPRGDQIPGGGSRRHRRKAARRGSATENTMCRVESRWTSSPFPEAAEARGPSGVASASASSSGVTSQGRSGRSRGTTCRGCIAGFRPVVLRAIRPLGQVEPNCSGPPRTARRRPPRHDAPRCPITATSSTSPPRFEIGRPDARRRRKVRRSNVTKLS